MIISMVAASVPGWAQIPSQKATSRAQETMITNASKTYIYE